MNEINKTDVKITQPVARTSQPEVKEEKTSTSKAENKDYKEAAAAPGAEAAGRAMVSMNKINKTDNIENDINAIIKNPQLAEDSDKLFNAAEKAGVPYPVAASFATSELSGK